MLGFQLGRLDTFAVPVTEFNKLRIL